LWTDWDLNIGLRKESLVIQLRTQTEAYWREYALSGEDTSCIYELILEAARPVSTRTLVLAVIEARYLQEKRLVQAKLSKGAVYQPRDHYEVGQKLIFPVFNYALATVVGTRPGHNPDYGDLTVIQVQFEGQDEIREFASELHGQHRLNRQEGEEEWAVADSEQVAAELGERYGSLVEQKLVPALAARDEFVRVDDTWFLRDLLTPITEGHLNIAEALIDIKAMPLPAAELVSHLDLPAEVPEEIQLLSLTLALNADPRFDNVGDSGRDIWYLRRLTPVPVIDPPVHLRLVAEPYDRQVINQELLLIEREIDDEGSGEEVFGPSRPLYKTSLTLTYPHWRAGTLPLTVRTRGLFPTPTHHHSPIVLVDGQSGDRMQGWVVHEHLFVFGLGDWYARYKVPVGALLKLERTRDPRVITVDLEARRLKPVWSRFAAIQDGRLVFQVRKMPVACEYDELIAIGEVDPQAIDEFRLQVAGRGESLFQIMVRVMPELIKLSPQGTVHAKTIYSAVNLLKRVPPGPIFALLSTEPCFVPMGGGYWTFDEALV